jgi:membrane protein
MNFEICANMGGTKKQTFRNIWVIARDTFKEFGRDKVVKLSAALAYYTIFSLPSMLIVIVGVCSFFFGREAITGEIFRDMSSFIGKEAALQIQEVLKNSTLKHDSVVATIIGVVTLLVAATGMFGEIQDSINSIWGLQAKPKKGWIKMLVNRVVSFSMVLVLGFVLLVSLILSALLEGFLDKLSHYFSDRVLGFMFVLDYAVMIVTTTILFAAILKVLPDAKIEWRDVWVGAFATCILFLIGKVLISYYLTTYSLISAYGAAGSMIVILLWVYYSAMILYLGAEFTQVYVRFHKRKIAPNKYAVWVEKNTVERKLNTLVNDHKVTLEQIEKTKKAS